MRAVPLNALTDSVSPGVQIARLVRCHQENNNAYY
jgi:hypothetical protein